MNEREAFEAWFNDWHDPNIGMIEVSVERTAGWHAWQAATLTERERAAKVCESQEGGPVIGAIARGCAAAIRKGETE